MRLWAVILALLLIVAPAANAKTHIRTEIAAGQVDVFQKFPIRWGFSCSFPKDSRLRQEVREGFRYWDDLTPAHLFEEEPQCGKVTPLSGILVIPVRVPYHIEGEIVEGTAYFYPPFGRQTGGAIALWEDWFTEEYADTRRSIIRHEVGHVLLFDHNPDTETCLMHPYINSDKHTYHGHEKQLCRSELWEFRKRFGGKLP